MLSHHFVERGVQRREVVLIFAHRGVDLVVAIMVVLAAILSVLNPLIIAQQMLLTVRQNWKDMDFPMSTIFQHPTLRGFAANIDQALVFILIQQISRRRFPRMRITRPVLVIPASIYLSPFQQNA